MKITEEKIYYIDPNNINELKIWYDHFSKNKDYVLNDESTVVWTATYKKDYYVDLKEK